MDLHDHESHRFDLDPRAADGFHVLAQIHDALAKGFAIDGAIHHQI